MSYVFRLASATGLVLAIVSNLHAAPVCSSIIAKRQAPLAVGSHTGAVQVGAGTQACAKNCEIAGLHRSDLKAALPAPTHLPVVSAPDEVAAWHAEIFEQLAASRAQSTQYCKLDL
jgi:hypothetical protein